MSNNENCITCATYKYKNQYCGHVRVNKYVDLCPCSLCLIKSMCAASCDMYLDFSEKADK